MTQLTGATVKVTGHLFGLPPVLAAPASACSKIRSHCLRPTVAPQRKNPYQDPPPTISKPARANTSRRAPGIPRPANRSCQSMSTPFIGSQAAKWSISTTGKAISARKPIWIHLRKSCPVTTPMNSAASTPSKVQSPACTALRNEKSPIRSTRETTQHRLGSRGPTVAEAMRRLVNHRVEVEGALLGGATGYHRTEFALHWVNGGENYTAFCRDGYKTESLSATPRTAACPLGSSPGDSCFFVIG